MNFELRDWKLDDAESLVKYANNPKVSCFLRNTFPSPYTLDDAHFFIDMSMHRDKNKQSIKAIVIDDVAVGSVGLLLQDDVSSKSAELGYWLGEPFWGKGIMTKAIVETCKNGFENFDIVRIYSRPFFENTGSRRALEKAGFEMEGVCRKAIYKNGNISDFCMYALTR